MCKCTPNIRTPYCGKGSCVWPNSKPENARNTKNNMDQYVLDLCFNKYICEDGSVIYWRDCILQGEMVHGEQGYMWIFEDGNHLHQYRTPAQCDL